MKIKIAPNGRRHGLRARLALGAARGSRTVLVFESVGQTYHWTTDRRPKVVVKH